MKAYLFSIGESTADVAKWSLERHGLDVVVLHDPDTSFWEKYAQFVEMAKDEPWVVRWDADVIAKREFGAFLNACITQDDYWWLCGMGYCHLKHNIVPVSGQVMNAEALEVCRMHINEVSGFSRPETQLTRVPELYNPRRFMCKQDFIGIHAYKQRESDNERVIAQKIERDQYQGWDHEFLQKLKKIA